MQKLFMHVAKSLDEAIALGTSVGCMSAVQRRMRAHLMNYLKLKFADALAASSDKPLGPEELNALLVRILGGT